MQLPRDRCFQALSADNSVEEVIYAASHILELQKEPDLNTELCTEILAWLRDQYFDDKDIKLRDLLAEVDDMDRIDHPDWPKAEMTAVAAALRTMAVRLAIYSVLSDDEQSKLDFNQAATDVLTVWSNE